MGWLRRRGGEAGTNRAEREEISQLVGVIVADDVVTEQEDALLYGRLQAMGWTLETFASAFPDLYTRYLIGRINDGRLPRQPSPQLLTKGSEIVYMEFQASLAKEVVDRQWQSGSQGVSFRVAKGVRYRVGQTRGHSVVVGSHLEVADQGVLSVTSDRAVFQGARKTVESRYARLVGLKLYTDAIQISVSNRQAPSLFRVAH